MEDHVPPTDLWLFAGSQATTVTSNTDIFVRRSTVPDFKNCMNDRQTMLFMVELHKWLKRKLYEETMKEASKHVLHPSKRQKFFRTNQ